MPSRSGLPQISNCGRRQRLRHSPRLVRKCKLLAALARGDAGLDRRRRAPEARTRARRRSARGRGRARRSCRRCHAERPTVAAQRTRARRPRARAVSRVVHRAPGPRSPSTRGASSSRAAPKALSRSLASTSAQPLELEQVRRRHVAQRDQVLADGVGGRFVEVEAARLVAEHRVAHVEGGRVLGTHARNRGLGGGDVLGRRQVAGQHCVNRFEPAVGVEAVHHLAQHGRRDALAREGAVARGGSTAPPSAPR